MIDNRLISSKTVLAKFIADLDIPDYELKISDCREWIMEAMLKIGAIQQYEHKVAILPIVHHQAKLPCDLYKLGQVAFSFNDASGWLPMRKSTSSFGVFHDCKGCQNKPEMLIQDSVLLPLVKNMFNLITDQEALARLNEDTQLRKTLSILLNQYTVGTVNGKIVGSKHRDSTMFSNELQYMTKPGYIMTNIPTGYVKIAYYAIYTDDEGMPLIPDLESYKEAIMWYLTVKYYYPKYLKGDINQSQYYDMRNSWNFYRKQAYAESMMPSVDDMESIKNIYNKLYPEVDDHDMFFSTSGDEQHIYNQNWV